MILEVTDADGTRSPRNCNVEGVRRQRKACVGLRPEIAGIGTRQRRCFLELEMGGRTISHVLCNCFLEALVADRDANCSEAFRADQHVDCMDDGFTTLTLLDDSQRRSHRRDETLTLVMSARSVHATG